MAKKRQVAVAEEPNRELDSTLLVDGKKYNINAVKADLSESAKKVEHTLSIECLDLDSNVDTVIEFNGNNDKSLEIIAASGGRFKGGIKVPASEKAIEEIELEDVLNYGDTKIKVVDDIVKDLANTSISYIWDGHELSATSDIPADAINKINSVSIVVGDDAGVETFAANNSDKGWLPTYLYLCSASKESSGNIYFGTKNSDTAIKLVASTDYATRAGTADLATSAVSLTSTLSIESGGTGATSAADAATNIITNQNIAPKTVQVSQHRWVIPKPTDPDKILSYVTYRDDDLDVYDGGFDLANSDLTNLNGVWFADNSNARGEGIMFLYRTDTKIPFKLDPVIKGEQVYDAWDRLYASDGTLYFVKGESNTSDGNKYKVFHSGSDFSSVTVGTATKAMNDVNGKPITSTYQKKILTGTIDPNSTSAPDEIKKAADGAIYIMYSNS
jgi:hypothetical protein